MISRLSILKPSSSQVRSGALQRFSNDPGSMVSPQSVLMVCVCVVDAATALHVSNSRLLELEAALSAQKSEVRFPSSILIPSRRSLAPAASERGEIAIFDTSFDL